MKTTKKALMGLGILFIILFFYSGFLFYQSKPYENPFAEEIEPITQKADLTDQVENQDRFPKKYSIQKFQGFTLGELPSYEFYRAKALNSEEINTKKDIVSEALASYESASDKMDKKTFQYNKKLDDYIRSYKAKKSS